MSLYDKLSVKLLLDRMRGVSDASEAFGVFCAYGLGHENIKVVLALEDYVAHDSFGMFERISKIDYVVPYYQGSQILVLSRDTVKAGFENKKADLLIDYTVMFDTNVASFISTMFRGRSLKGNHDRVIKLLDAIIYGDYNFDHLFYMCENIKLVRVKAERWKGNKVDFWRSLKKDFRWNISALMYFRMIDCGRYVKSSQLSFGCSFRQAVRKARDTAFDYYVSPRGRDAARAVVLMQREMLLLLLVAIRINFSSGRGARSKFKELLYEVQNLIGVFHERELSVLLAYFQDSKSVAILGAVNKGGRIKKLLKRVDNIAWDFFTPRSMELVINATSTEKIMLPFLATFDENLSSMLDMFSIKGSVLSVDEGLHLPVGSDSQVGMFEKFGVMGDIEAIFSEEMIERRSVVRSKTIEEQFIKIKSEYAKLRAVMRA